MNTAGQPIAILMEVQTQPAYVRSGHPANDTRTSCIRGFSTSWSGGNRAGFIIGITLGGLVVLVFIIWLCCFMQNSGSRGPDEEESYDLRSRDRKQGPGEREDSRRKRINRSTHTKDNIQDRNRNNRRHSSVSSGSYIEPPNPLPRVVPAEGRCEERRVSRVPRHKRSDASSLSSAGAVVGVGKRDSLRDAIYIPDEAFDATAHRYPTEASRLKMEIKMTTAANKGTISRTASKARDSHSPQHRLRRSSRQGRDVGQYERGRSPVRKSSYRKPHPKLQSCSPYPAGSLYRPDSPPTDNRDSFRPNIPLTVALLEDLGEKAEQTSPRIGQRNSSIYPTDPQLRSQRKSCREDRRIRRQRQHSSQVDQSQRNRSFKQDFSMSGGLEGSSAGIALSTPRRSGRRRLSNQI